jgi:DNA (cytosine-5)-methyltransferase 1
VWENVPGVLSSNGGKDFGTFLGALGELGYGFAYRVLDAQHFGVAQRRRRVFVVGYLGDWRVAAAVLFERESLQGNPKPSRKKREEVTANAEGSVGEAGQVVIDRAAFNQGENAQYEPRIETGETMSSLVAKGPHAVAQPIAYSFDALSSNSMKSSNPNSGCRTVDVAKTLDTATPEPSKNQGGIAIAQPIAIQDVRPIEKAQNGRGWNDDGTSYTVDTKATQGVAQPIAFQLSGDRDNPSVSVSDTAFCIPANPMSDRSQAVAQPIAFKVRGGCEGGGKGYLGQEEQAFTISATQDQQIAQPIAVDTYNYTTNDHTTQTIRSQSDTEHIGAVLHSMAIRRLTPKECERLQGFPDDWTKIPYRNKPADQCPDGPRYKACGNSMAVPVMRWIGERINLIESML